MIETAAEYKARLTALVNGRDPLELQRGAPARFAELIALCHNGDADARPFAGKWTVRQVAAHLADLELVTGYRMRSILAAPGMAIASFDPDQWAVEGQYEEVSLDSSVQRFTALRQWNLELLGRTDPAHYARAGMHSERGEESVQALIVLVAGHDINHLLQIEKILKHLGRL